MGNNTHINDFEPIGNQIQCTIDNGQLTTTNIYSANQLNQYTDILNSQFSTINYHDPDGNTTWNGRQVLSYDAENRLLSASPSYWATTNGATRTDYTYDYMNRRVSKTTSIMSGRSISYPPSPLDPQGAWSALETSKYIYDEWSLIAEIIIDQTEFTTNINCYTWGLDFSGTLQGAGGIGGLLSEIKTGSSSPTVYFALSDANGNVTEYIDDTGTVQAHYEYNAFGETAYKFGTMKDDFNFRFSTKYFDPETGFYYYGKRYYDPILGRWISTDPIEESDGPGRYLFLENDGLNKIDLLGMWSATSDSKGKPRRIYKWESGDTLESLAKELRLNYSEVSKWMNSVGSDKSGNGVPCKVSVPNVWISADLLRGGGVYSRLVNLGGTMGQFFGTDLLTYGFHIEKPNTIQQLLSSLSANKKMFGAWWYLAMGTKRGNYRHR